ncbi:PTS sugar transporter subunit IIC [Lactiplantibacillus pentosus]|uniref:PTS sugar transporter subunit IIC n=1 Tax=Lactiplantibacillus pentosus TaxID=1589 RepID=UPI000EAAC60B|nr:PTS sugar transporter subunit IIC [Lactiplantibacillus pentosus]AYG37340.1 PTS sugar transporter subunit IIC [Lactiplantibacillus pentosus]AYG39996.1 PTS sugar transporter subunit IIC [Lactiplantibacillus pentosus]
MKKYNIQSIIDWLYRISTLQWFNYLQSSLIAAFPIIVVNGFLETILQTLMTDNGFFVVIFHLEHFVASNAIFINQLTVLVQLLQVFANTIIAVQFSRNVIKPLDNNIACGAMAAFSFIILSIKLGQNNELIFLIHGVTFALLTGLGVSKCFDFFRVEVDKDNNDRQNALIATLTNIKPIICIIVSVLALKMLNFEIGSNGVNVHLHSIIQTALTDNHYSLIPMLLILFLRSVSKFMGINADFLFGFSTRAQLVNLNHALKFSHPVTAVYPTAYSTLYACFANLGGDGMLLALIIVVLVIGKNQHLKRLLTWSFIPTFFNFSEPVMVGFPIMYMPIYLIPFIMSPLVTTVIAYPFLKYNIVPAPVYPVPNGTPGLMKAFIASGGNIPILLLALFCLVVSCFIYLPFVKAEVKLINLEHTKFSASFKR